MSARHRPARNASNVVNLTRYKKIRFPSDADFLAVLRTMTKAQK